MKFLTLNVVFDNFNFGPVRSRNSPYEGVKLRYPFQNASFQPLERREPRDTGDAT